jgi:DNA repair protein RadA/Sms
MASAKRVFSCRTCGAVQSRWMGKCPDCGAWDALEEQRVEKSAKKDPQRGLIESWQGSAGAGTPEVDSEPLHASASNPARPIGEINDQPGRVPRISTGIDEFDRVLGGGPSGGLVPGSAVLVGGDPGIGKSTLLLQAAGAMGRDASGPAVLYVSSEESAEQVRLRASRLGAAASPGLMVLSDTNLARIVEQTRRVMPRVLIIDSVQMIYKADLDAAPGSITQLRRCCAELVYLAKLSGIAVVLVGHVTKDGQLAGPRLLEHLVDAVLYFEGDRYHAHRVLRGVKNRFGTTLEIGVFEMTGQGLKQAPAGLGAGVLMDVTAGGKPRIGSALCPVMNGSRCLLVELQALTATGFLGAAKRKSSGLDPSRLAMLIAVLEQHAELRLADRDVFASSVGGIRVVEPAADLALLLAIASAHFKKPVDVRTGVVGEVGLGGEVRPVAQLDQRVSEAARLGCTRLIVPAGRAAAELARVPGCAIDRVVNIDQAIERLG